ncbi:hypothetical protein ACOZ35_13715 [Halorubrum xinjiangense]|uniref:Uncharacterized protein n=1 Tax=Halorubrum distributum JCM 13916 TaxID=1230455 RepID=M0PMG2_9EURY|nr:hypothetical protein [Halorubrum arcis]EMA71098.1 hypothetical protein C462_08260 [Halorubrum arcis JCM 13916]
MRRTGEVLLAGVAAAGVAVGLLVLVEASTLLIPTGALGAAIPVSLIYAVVTADGTDADGSR